MGTSRPERLAENVALAPYPIPAQVGVELQEVTPATADIETP